MRLASLFLFLLTFASCTTQTAPTEPPDAVQLIGKWEVDLRPVPDAEPYYQSLVVTDVSDKTFSGTFYGTPVTQARVNTDWYSVRIAFVTEDQSGPYHHSAVLSEDRLEGLSNSTGRDFLSYWSARKAR